DFAFLGNRTVLFTNSPSPCRLKHSALDGCAQHSHPQQCDYSESHTLRPLVKHSQHTVNPFIILMLTPSCPVPLVQCQCFCFLALITVLVSLGKSVTPSQFPPVSECL
ncbi:unnamed protein product, partial [Staurois parvus]